MVVIPVSQSGMKISVNSVFNAQKVMITDGQLTSCSSILNFECPKDAEFCAVEELDEVADIPLQDEVCGLDFVYLYALPEEVGGELAIEVKLSSTGEVNCVTNNAHKKQEDTLVGPSSNHGEPTGNHPVKHPESTPANQEPEVATNNGNTETTTAESGSTDTQASSNAISDQQYCAQLDFDTCESSTTDVCLSKCMWVNCKVTNQENLTTQTSSGCVPVTWSNANLQQMCNSMEEFAKATTEHQVIEHPVCEQKAQQNINDTGSHSHVLRVVGFVLLAFFFVFMVVVCYYRYQFRKNRVGPFSPPSWCPNCLFPTMSHEDIHMFLPIGARKKNQDMEMDYNPPVL